MNQEDHQHRELDQHELLGANVDYVRESRESRELDELEQAQQPHDAQRAKPARLGAEDALERELEREDRDEVEREPCTQIPASRARKKRGASSVHRLCISPLLLFCAILLGISFF